MKKIIIIAALALLSATAVSAQNYKWAVGIRGGGEMAGLDLKYKFDSSNGLEAIFAFPYDGGFIATMLYERSIPVINRDFSFFYGGGAHVGSWGHKFAIGIDGIAGLEYTLPDVPLAFSIDYKPVFNIASRTKFYMADIALSMRVTF